MTSREESENRFDDFLMLMDDQIDWLFSEAGRFGVELLTDIGDCEKLEALFDAMSDGLDKDQTQKLSVVFARQLGELVRQNYGGRWVLSWNNDNSMNRGLPVLIGHCPVDGVEFAPLRVMHFYALRRNRGLLRRSIEADVQPSPLALGATEE